MKLRFSLLVLAWAGSLLCAMAQPRSYHAPRAQGRMHIDGRLTEPDWARAPLSEPFADIRGVDFEPAPVKETRVRMIWDKDYLYIGAFLEEDRVTATLKEHDSIIFHDNDFEVFLDPDADARTYFEIEINAFGTVMDLLMDKPYKDGGHFFLPWDCRGLRSAVRVDGRINRDGTPDRGWTVEMAIPFDALQVDFTDPRTLNPWRINFSRVEWLVPGGPEENWVWNPTGVVDMHVPDRWGLLYFEP